MLHIVSYGDGSSAIYDVLREQIISGTLRPGQELVIESMAEEMEVSTVALREAIRWLAEEKLVELRPRLCPIVAELNIAELLEMNSIRAALEPVVLADAIPRHTPATLKQCRQILERACKTNEAWKLMELNKEFHLALLDPSTMRRAIEIITEQYDGIVHLTQLLAVINEDAHNSVHDRQHVEILKAVEKGNVKKGAAMMQKHIGTASAWALKRVRDSGAAVSFPVN